MKSTLCRTYFKCIRRDLNSTFALGLSCSACETSHLIKPNFQAGQKPWSFLPQKWESCTNKKLQERASSEKQMLKEEISWHPPCFAWLLHYPHRQNSLVFQHSDAYNHWYLPRKLHSPESGFQGGPASDRNGIWKCWFLRRGENGKTRRKTSRSRVKNQRPT